MLGGSKNTAGHFGFGPLRTVEKLVFCRGRGADTSSGSDGARYSWQAGVLEVVRHIVTAGRKVVLDHSATLCLAGLQLEIAKRVVTAH